MLSGTEDTIVAISTPPGNGAIAVLRLSGDRSIELVDQFFKPATTGKFLSVQDANTIHFGRIIEGERVIDEVLVSLFRAPHSYTGENIVEISCHGSLFIQQELLQLFIRTGARLALPGEFTRRAFLHGKMDLSQAEAVADLIASSSVASHRIAIEQMRGGFSGSLARLRSKLLNFISLIELELDFSEEDVEFADRRQLVVLITKVQDQIKRLLSSFSTGNALKNGIPVVIAGLPNVGKSTLLNSLFNEEKAIVSEVPGTTRDAIEDVLHIQGYLFRIIDTAGLRQTRDVVETIGIRKTRERLAQARIILLVADITMAGEELKKELNVLPGNGTREVIILANKADKLQPADLEERLKGLSFLTGKQVLPFSAKTGFNLDKLKILLVESVKKDLTDSSVTITNARHYEALLLAGEAVQRVMEGLSSNVSGELLAQDIREILHYLGEITGEITNDEILGNIFRNFCIGK
jgi:tRNA modification GTPase